MKSGTLKVISIVPLGVQCFAMASAISLVSFIVPVTQRVIEEAEGQVPAPSRLLVENSGVAKLLLVGLFGASVITYFRTRKKVKGEADQLAIQSMVYSFIWYLGITVLGGIVMAGLLPYFALESTPE